MMVTALTQAAQIFDRPIGRLPQDLPRRRALSDASGYLCRRDARRLDVSLAAIMLLWGRPPQRFTRPARPIIALAEADAHHLHAHFADERGGYFSNRTDETGLLVNNGQCGIMPSHRPMPPHSPCSQTCKHHRQERLAAKAANGFQALAGHLAQNYASMTEAFIGA